MTLDIMLMLICLILANIRCYKLSKNRLDLISVGLWSLCLIIKVVKCVL